MALIEPNGRPHKMCPKCHTCIILPATLGAEEQSKVAQIRRSKDATLAFSYLEQHHDLNPREAKALTIHITLEKGICHKCGYSLLKDELNCPRCKSINLEW